MNEMIISKATTEFEVLTINKEPQVGDKWEDKRNIYTITGIQEIYLSMVPLDGDVWGKEA